MTTEAQATISRDNIYEAVRTAYRKSLIRGGGSWYYVRVWPDGTISDGIEASPCYPESEYYKRVPHPVTIWEYRSNSDLNEDEVDAAMDGFDWDWFDLNVGDLDERLAPTGLKIQD